MLLLFSLPPLPWRPAWRSCPRYWVLSSLPDRWRHTSYRFRHPTLPAVQDPAPARTLPLACCRGARLVCTQSPVRDCISPSVSQPRATRPSLFAMSPSWDCPITWTSRGGMLPLTSAQNRPPASESAAGLTDPTLRGNGCLDVTLASSHRPVIR